MPKIFSVRELTRYIRQVLEEDDTLVEVWVEGEVSNLSHSTAGHLYFTLKEEGAQITCVLFRGAAGRLTRLPRDGEAVLARGRVSFYEAGGKLQLYVEVLRPLGLGELYIRLLERKERLEAEGLFDPTQKRPLPAFPRRIGVVTSPTGAALRDILHVLERRYPPVEVLLSPTPVQGEDAAPQIVAALERLRGRGVDLILIARGGGSLEDLWPFNEEQVARAIRAAPAPVISGIGHETDWTIADLAADRRAPTPSVAAEVAVPDRAELRGHLLYLRERLERSVEQRLARRRERLVEQVRRLGWLSPQAQIAGRRQQVDDLSGRLYRNLRHRLALARQRRQGLALRLSALGPQATLQRGYAVVRKRDGAVVVSPAQVSTGEGLEVRVRDGSFQVEVKTPAHRRDGGNA